MWNDLRFALRTLRRSPGFTLVAVLSLALGIGANTAIFSLIYQVVLRSVPVRDPERLVLLESDNYNLGWTRADNRRAVFSYPMYRELRDRNQVFSGLLARASFPATLAFRGSAVRVSAEVVSGNFFEVLGVRPALGRLLMPSDDVPGANPVIVLSYPFWEGQLGRDPAVLNGPITMNGRAATIVGVAAPRFLGLLSGQTPEFFAPISMMGMISPGWHRAEEASAYWLSLFGRLKPGISYPQANAALLPLFRAVLADQLPQMDADQQARRRTLARPMTVAPASRGLNELRDQWQKPLLVLMVMVGLVLLIACANVASLLLARATARQREIAVRMAIGGAGWQIARQLLVESLVLAVGGGLLGLLLSAGLTRGLLGLLPADATGGWLAAQLDLRLLGCSLALSLTTGLLFGLAPAVQAIRPQLVLALKEQSTGMSGGGQQARIRQGLVVAQIGISLLLLIGAGLFTRSLLNLLSNQPGFQADHLVTFSIDPSLSGYTRPRSLALFRELGQRLANLPGASAAARAAFSPFGGHGWGNGVKVPGSRNASQSYVDCGQDAVDADYFSALGIPLVAGRVFTANDTAAAPKVAVINETFARFLFDTENPVGRHMRIGSNDADAEIVGVVKDSKYGNLREKPSRFMYVPYEQVEEEFARQSAFFVRTRGSEESLMAAVRQTVRQLDSNLPMQHLTSMQVMIDDSIYTDRLIATLAVAFGALATLLAAVGLYGMLAYSVARRTREFGIRLVLGAVPGTLLLSLMKDLGRVIALGVALGLPASYLLARLVESQFFGVRAYDPRLLTGATLLIVLVSFLAGLAPAVRAMRTEPVRALRYE